LDNKKDNEHICCDTVEVHESIVNKIKAKSLEDELLYDLADLFKVFGDTTRIKLLWALDNQELCVCDLAEILGMSMSAVSHQLRILKQTRLVKNRREGKNIFYSLDDHHIHEIFEKGLEHIREL